VAAAHRNAPGKPANAGRPSDDVHARLSAWRARTPPAAIAADRSAAELVLRSTTSSAAADGVGARPVRRRNRRSSSVSWPDAEITGTGTARSRAPRPLR
jgi:hypothetical protein